MPFLIFKPTHQVISLNPYRNGGIDPNFAQELHRLHIENVVTEALQGANLTVADVDAIAVTNRPGKLERLSSEIAKKNTKKRTQYALRTKQCPKLA